MFDSAKSPLIQITSRQIGHSDADGFRHLPKIAGAGAGYVLSSPGGGADPIWSPLSGVSVTSVFGRSGAVVAGAGDYSAYYQPLSTKLTNFAALANTSGVLTNDGAGNLTWSTVSGVSVTSFNTRTGAVVPAAGDYDTYYWTKAQTTALVGTRSPRNRWPVDSSHGYAFTWAYDSATRRPTITPTSSTFSVWLHGVEQVFTGAQALPVHANVTGVYFYYLDTDGAFKVSTTPWNLLSQVPVILVYYNASKAVGKAYSEFHTEEITGLEHESDHRTIGTKFVQGGAALSGYTLNVDSSAAVTFGVAACELYDEDLYHQISALTDGSTYEIWYQSGSSGAWTWDDAVALPYKVGATYITANQLVSTTWQQVQLDGSGVGQYVNMYVVPTPCKNGPQYIIMQGQGIFATQADAEGEAWSNLSLTNFPVMEFVPVWRVTFWARSSFTGVTGRVKIAAVTQVATTRGGAAGGSSVHNALTGRSDADCHPFAALTGILGATQFPALTGDVTTAAGSLATTVGKINGTSLAGLGTGILKNTTGTGIPSIAVAADFPTLNQNTTGNAATASKWASPIALTIGATGQNVDGSGPITFTLASIGALPASGGSTGKLAKWSSSSALSYGILSDDGDFLHADPGSAAGGRFKSRYAGANATFVGNSNYPTDYWGFGSDGSTSAVLRIANCSAAGVFTANPLAVKITGSLDVSGLGGASDCLVAAVASTGLLRRAATADLPGGPYLPLSAGSGSPLSGELYANLGLRIPSTQTFRIGATAQVTPQASYTSLAGFGSPWQFGLSSTVFSSAHTVAATFREGIDCLSTSYMDSLTVQTSASLSGVTFLDCVGTTKLNRVIVTASTYTLPTVAIGETLQIIFDVSSCAVDTGTQSVSLRRDTGAIGNEAAGTTIGSTSYGKTGSRIRAIFLVGVTSTTAAIIG